MSTNLEDLTKSVAEQSSENAAADWNDHEHVSSQVQLEAEKLVELVGTPELAKQAINVVEQKQQLSTTGDSGLAASLANSRRASAQISEAFLKALSALETSLATPVVSGELNEWAANALRDCERVKEFLLGGVQKIHEDLFSSIVRENVDLTTQVEKLRAADNQISHADCDAIILTLNQLKIQVDSALQDEAKLSDAVASTVKQALDFVVAARGQETAISTWMNEAFNRDLGSGD